MATLRLASLWERRLSGDSDDSLPDDADAIPLELTPFRSNFPPRKPAPPRRPRPRVSANKPPVAPPLAPAALTHVEEVPLADGALLDGMSPVSSFVGSAGSPPGSPGLVDRPPSLPDRAPDGAERSSGKGGGRAGGGRGSAMLEEIRELRRRVRSWDPRITELEEQQRSLQSQIDSLNKRFSAPG